MAAPVLFKPLPTYSVIYLMYERAEPFRKKKAEEQEQRSLEENFSELEELIEQLEAEDISLEDAFTAYSKGMNVLKQCNEQIDRVEKQVMKLNEEGGLEPLDPQ